MSTTANEHNTTPQTPPRTTRQTIQDPPPLIRHTQRIHYPISQEEINYRDELFHTLIEQQNNSGVLDILSIDIQEEIQ